MSVGYCDFANGDFGFAAVIGNQNDGVVGDIVLGLIGIHGSGFIGGIIVSVVGACILIWLSGKLRS